MTDRKLTLRVSKDGGRNFGNAKERSLGELGEYRKRVVFTRLGQQRTASVAIRVSSPIDVSIMGAAARITPADS